MQFTSNPDMVPSSTLITVTKIFSPSPTLDLEKSPTVNPVPLIPQKTSPLPFLTLDQLLPGEYLILWNYPAYSLEIVSVNGTLLGKYLMNLDIYGGQLSPDKRLIASNTGFYDYEGHKLSFNGIAILNLYSNEMTNVGENCYESSWSPDNKMLALACGNEIQIYSYQEGKWGMVNTIPRPKETDKLPEDKRDRVYLNHPAWSPDGKWIVFNVDYGLIYAGTLKPAPYGEGPYITDTECIVNGGDCREKTHLLTNLNGLRNDSILTWSPDNTYLMVTNIEEGSKQHNEILNIQNGQLVSSRMNVYTDFLVNSMVCSPDGNWFAYQIDGDPVIYKSNLKGDLDTLYSGDSTQIIAWINIPAFSFQIGSLYSITANGDNLKLHETPALDGTVKSKLQTDENVTILDGPIEADGYRWWKMRTADGLEGWAVENYYWFTPIPLIQATSTTIP
jgi:dipeptidyl aminopeptidase/acylaminoacyl peptidase